MRSLHRSADAKTDSYGFVMKGMIRLKGRKENELRRRNAHTGKKRSIDLPDNFPIFTLMIR